MKQSDFLRNDPEEDNPSTILTRYWQHAYNERVDYADALETSGKWCIFINKAHHDMWWKKIRESLYAGELGKVIKTSTGLVNPNSSDSRKAVIVVFTYDSEDVEDVKRIRQSLYVLGITWKIAYKTESATFNGKYQNRGDKEISLFYE